MYESITASTLKVLRELPTILPSRGVIVGFAREHTVPFQDMFLNDNYHFPMGTAFLKLGVLGIAEKAEQSAARVEAPERKELLNSIGEVYRAVAAYFIRLADAAASEASHGDTARYQRMERNLRALAAHAPQSFEQALQLYYLLWKLRCLNSFCSDLGRLDVHLRPYFERDLAQGTLTEQEAQNLLCEFWEKLNENNSGDTLINVMVGGSNPDGSDAGSRLSVLMLRATLLTKKTEPHINVRIHPKLNPEIYQTMLQVQLMGHGQATVYNDEIVIPNLIKFGVPKELAYSYVNDGCTEIMLDGYSGIDFAHIDAVATFELAFNDGAWASCDYRTPVQYWHKDCPAIYYTPDAVPGYSAGRAEDCGSFAEFFELFLRQYAFQVRNKAEFLRRMESDRLLGGKASVLLNGTYDYVLDSGLDVLRGGFPFADYMMFSGSIPTVADCLMAVKKLVFTEKRYTIAQLKQAIAVNYEGYEDMRQCLLDAPKFGNDIDEVDLLAADIAAHFCQWLDDYRKQTGFAILPALLGWRFLEEAHGIAATPDGRKYAEPIAEHYCATPGRAVNGPTALLRSIGKAKDAIVKAVGVCAVHVTLPRNLGSNDEESLAILDALVSGAFANGLNQMNIAIYDAELLRQAQRDPANHKDLIVRVWGYSARFVDLCPEMQEHVIRRIV